jgi:hypothetical protein
MALKEDDAMLQQVALVSQARSVPHGEVSRVAAAIQKQVARDFGPLWSVTATVDGFARLADVPLGYWPVIVRDDVGDNYNAAGIHLDDNGQPFSLVQASDEWPQTASHETLEMLADPFGKRVIAGLAPKEAKKQGRVEFLVEVCDPSEATAFGYTVNDVLLSDFYTPNFFDPVAAPGVRYSFTGAITAPRQVLEGGYISWHNTVNNHWYQLRWFTTARPTVADLGVFDASSKSTREWIDEQTHTPLRVQASRARMRPNAMFASLAPGSGTSAAASAWATRLEAQIATLLQR